MKKETELLRIHHYSEDVFYFLGRSLGELVVASKSTTGLAASFLSEPLHDPVVKQSACYFVSIWKVF